MAVIEVRATCVLVSILLGKKIDLRCLSFKSKKKCLLVSLWSELGHMAIEPVTWRYPWNFGALGIFRAFLSFMTYSLTLLYS